VPIEIEEMQTEVHVGKENPLQTTVETGRPGSPAEGATAARAALEGLVLGIVEEALERMVREVN
jgi:hypothetical protein